MRRTTTIIAVLALAALGLGLLSATALAGKKKSTSVVFFTGYPKFSNGKGNTNVTAKGALNTVKACKISRSVKLQLLDSTGTVTGTIDGSTTDSNGNWILSGQLPSSVPAGTNSVRVKANKVSAGKYVCKAGVSPSVQVPVR
jgi:hypothetical protein